MSDPIATLAFGEAAGGRWGALWSDGSSAVAVIAGDSASPLRLDAAPAGTDEWRLRGEGVQAVVSGVRAWIRAGELAAQACRVSGQVGAGQCDWPGVRTLRARPGRIDSLRQVLAWFGAQRAVALDATRAQGSPGHERDRVCSAILCADLEAAVQEARLSTTYDGAGLPLRVGLELWLADEQEHPFPHRVAGEALARGVAVGADGLRLHVSPLSAHYRGEDGGGVLILARPA